MSQPRSRLFVQIVLIVAVIGLVGFSILPLVSTGLKDSQSIAPTTSDSASATTQQAKKLQEEARGYELVLEREPENQTALQGLIQAKIQLRDYKGAIAPLEKLAALDPKQVEVRLALAQLYTQQQSYDNAIAVYEQAMQADGQDFRPVLGKAILLKQQGKNDSSQPLFEKAIALAPAELRDKIKNLQSMQESQKPETANPQQK